MITKTCAKCEQKLPLDAFHKHSGNKSCRLNLVSRCKKCRAEDRKVSNVIKLENKRKLDNRLQINQLSDIDAAYIAGFVDGEGCLSLCRVNANDPNRTTNYVIRLRVSNTFPGIIDWIALKVGFGSVRSTKKYKDHYKQPYEWYLTGRRATVLLKQLYPYLKVKKLQAEVLFEYAETLMPPGQAKIPHNVIDARKTLKAKITCLNWRGDH